MKKLIITAALLLTLNAMGQEFQHPPIKDHVRARLLAGQGTTRYKHTRIGTFNTIEAQSGFVYGVGVDVPLNRSLSIGAEMTSNGNQLLSVGISL